MAVLKGTVGLRSHCSEVKHPHLPKTEGLHGIEDLQTHTIDKQTRGSFQKAHVLSCLALMGVIKRHVTSPHTHLDVLVLLSRDPWTICSLSASPSGRSALKVFAFSEPLETSVLYQNAVSS